MSGLIQAKLKHKIMRSIKGLNTKVKGRKGESRQDDLQISLIYQIKKGTSADDILGSRYMSL